MTSIYQQAHNVAVEEVSFITASCREPTEISRSKLGELKGIRKGIRVRLELFLRVFEDAEAVALAIDGAIIRAQIDQAPRAALSALEKLWKCLMPPKT